MAMPMRSAAADKIFGTSLANVPDRGCRAFATTSQVDAPMSTGLLAVRPRNGTWRVVESNNFAGIG
jgi:hypothetical protein